MQLSDVLLAGLYPVVWQITEWLKPLLPQVTPVAINVVVAVLLVTMFYVCPESVQTYILTVALPVGTAAAFHEAQKLSNAAADASI